MRNFNTTKNEIQQPRRDLLEETRLSRLPIFDNAPSKAAVVVAVCGGCGGRLESDNDFQQSVKICRKCLAHYAKIDAAIDEATKRKRRELLEKFVAEVK